MAKIFTIIFWLVTTIDFYGPVPSPLKYILCFIPNIALNFAFKVIFQFERSGTDLITEKMKAYLFILLLFYLKRQEFKHHNVVHEPLW